MRTTISKSLVLLCASTLLAFAQAPDPELIARLEEEVQQLEGRMSGEITALRGTYRQLEEELKKAQDDRGAKAIADLARVLEPVLTKARELGGQRTKLNRSRVREHLAKTIPAATEALEHPALVPLKLYLAPRIARVMAESGDVLDCLDLEVSTLADRCLQEALEATAPFHIRWNTCFSAVLPEAESYRAVQKELTAARRNLDEARDPFLRFRRDAPEGFAWIPKGDYIVEHSGPYAGRGARKKARHVRISRQVGVGLHEVTHSQYHAWIKEMDQEFFKKHMPKGPDGKMLWTLDKETGLVSPLPEIAEHPVVGISLRSAVAFAASQGARLPTEAEWCAVAAGKERRVYPWGDEYRDGLCNDRKAGIKATQPVGSYEAGRGPFGHYDLAGNVSEWVLTYESGKDADHTNLDDANAAVRGGSFRQDPDGVTTSWFWLRRALHETDIDVGFRLAIDGP